MPSGPKSLRVSNCYFKTVIQVYEGAVYHDAPDTEDISSLQKQNELDYNVADDKITMHGTLDMMKRISLLQRLAIVPMVRMNLR